MLCFLQLGYTRDIYIYVSCAPICIACAQGAFLMWRSGRREEEKKKEKKTVTAAEKMCTTSTKKC